MDSMQCMSPLHSILALASVVSVALAAPASAGDLAGFCSDRHLRSVGLASGAWHGLSLGRVERTEGGALRAALVAPFVYAGMPVLAVHRGPDGVIGFELATSSAKSARESADRAGVAGGLAFVDQGGRPRAVCRAGI